MPPNRSTRSAPGLRTGPPPTSASSRSLTRRPPAPPPPRRMRKKTLSSKLAAFVFAFCLAGLACEPRVAPARPATPTARPAAAPAPVTANPVFLWRAQLGASTVHFLGSVHVARPELYPLDP